MDRESLLKKNYIEWLQVRCVKVMDLHLLDILYDSHLLLMLLKRDGTSVRYLSLGMDDGTVLLIKQSATPFAVGLQDVWLHAPNCKHISICGFQFQETGVTALAQSLPSKLEP